MPLSRTNLARAAKYAAAWALLLLCAVSFLFALRHYGEALTNRLDLRALLNTARREFDRGDPTTAEKTVLGLLDKHPELAGAIVDRFAINLLAFPRVYALLTASDIPSAIPKGESGFALTPLQRAKLLLIAGHTQDAKSRLASLDDSGPRSAEMWLWLARLALTEGDIQTAKTHFDEFWRTTTEDRDDACAAIVRDILGLNADPVLTGERSVELAHRLFWTGLWDEAFAVVRKARASGRADAELDFYEGVALELDGHTHAAGRAYAHLLTTRPNHALALLRLREIGVVSP